MRRIGRMVTVARRMSRRCRLDLNRSSQRGVNGHLVLPNCGRRFSPLVAMVSPHRGFLGWVQCRGVTPLPAVAWASR